jgi:hypothetical protein
LVLLYVKCAWFRNAVNAVFHAVIRTAQTFGKVLGATFGWIGRHWRGLLDAFLLVSGPVGWVTAYVIHHFDQVKKSVGAVLSWLGKLPGLKQAIGVAKSVAKAIGGAFGDMVGWVRNHWNEILRTIGGVINRIAGFIETAFGWMGIKVPRVSWGAAQPGAYNPNRYRATGAPKRTATGGGAKDTGVVGDIGSALSHTASAAAGALGNAADWVFDVAGAAWPTLPKLGGPLAGLLGGLLSAVKNALGKKLGGLFGGRSPGAILNFAKQFLGVPYLWGGVSPAGFDCSGLMMYVFKHFGINLPRTAAQQQRVGRAVRPPYLPADLLFFGSPAHHVGMYAGRGLMLDAPHCLPTDNTEILTRRGWLQSEQVGIGDETLGYDFGDGTLRWTPVTAVNTFRDVDVLRLGIDHWSVEATGSHRWVNQKQNEGAAKQRAGRVGLIPLSAMTQGSRLILSAPAATAESLPITEAEAELVGWVMGDGSVRVRRSPGYKNGNSWRYMGGTVEMTLSQSKDAGISEIRTLLAGVPHKEKGRPGHHSEREIREWHFPAPYARDLLQRAAYFSGSPSQMILAMSPPQREVWLRGMWGADGHRTRPTIIISQNDGEVQDAVALCMYLLGYRPRYCDPGRSGFGSTKPRRRVSATKPRMTVRDDQFSVTSSRRAEVWCPTTGLGSWTARQGEHIFLTGNSGARVRLEPFNWPDFAGGRRLLDRGGWLPPGVTLAVNNTGRPERVLSPRESGPSQVVVPIYLDGYEIARYVIGIKDGLARSAAAMAAV